MQRNFTVVKELGNENVEPIDAFSYVVNTGYQFKSLFSKQKLSLCKSYEAVVAGGTSPR